MAKKLKSYFDQDLLDFLGIKLKNANQVFDEVLFREETEVHIPNYELKDRIRIIGKALDRAIPGSYTAKLNSLVRILGPENPGAFGTFNDYFWQWPLSSVVEQFGLEDREASFGFIYELTKRSTGEFAVRPFLLEDPEYVFDKLHSWSLDSNFHVRRLSSEGLRPLLRWGKKCDYFIDQPERIFDLLFNLSSDDEKYVLTSVANHMGDMLKLNPEPTKERLIAWSAAADKPTRWLIRHSIRNLRKKGDAWAMEMTKFLQ